MFKHGFLFKYAYKYTVAIPYINKKIDMIIEPSSVTKNELGLVLLITTATKRKQDPSRVMGGATATR